MHFAIEAEDTANSNQFSTSLWNYTNFEEVVNQYEAGLYRFIYSLVQDRQLTQDLVQDTFYNAYYNLVTEEHKRREYFKQHKERANFKGWLYIIARNNALSALRRRKIFAHIATPTSISNTAVSSENLYWFENLAAAEPENGYENNLAQREELVQAINQLGQKRIIPLLLVVEGFSYQEIARISGKTLGAVKSEIFRVKKDLRTILCCN